MANITFKGNPVSTSGSLPVLGAQAPDFRLVANDLSEKTLSSFSGKKKILSVNPSFDTGVCQKTARMFNQAMSDRSDVAVLLISADLPFAQKRFCEADGLQNITTLSTFRSTFSQDFGFLLSDGPLQGLNARGVVVLDENNKVTYSALVPEVTNEPDYDAVTKALGR